MRRSIVLLFLFTIISSASLATGPLPADKVQNLNLLAYQPSGICETVSGAAGVLAVGDGASVDFYDTSVPATPQFQGSVVVPARVVYVKYASALTFIVTGDYWDPGFRVNIVDSSDPANPAILGSLYVTSNVHAITQAGSIIYLSTSSETTIVDISSPAAPIRVGSTGSSLSAEARGSRLYLGTSNGTFRIMDITTPTAPVELGSIVYSSSIYGLAISADEQTAYLSRYGIQVVDISTPSAPSHVGEFSLGQYYFFSKVAVTSAGVYALGGGTVHLIDTSVPAAPVEAGQFDTARYATDLSVDPGLPDYCSVAVGAGALLLDFSTPATPADAASIVTGYYINEIVVQDTPPAQGTLEATADVQVTTASTLGGVGRYHYTAPSSGDPFQVLPPLFATLFGVELEGVGVVKTGNAVGDPVVVGTKTDLRFVDAANDTTPLLWSIDLPFGSAALAWDGGKVAAADGVTSSVTFIDGTDPNNPVVEHTEDIGYTVLDLDWRDGQSVLSVVTGNSPEQVKLYNAVIATAPVLLSAFSPGSNIVAVDVLDTFMYVVDTTNWIYIYDITDGTNPIQVGAYDLATFLQISSLVAAYPSAPPPPSTTATYLYVTAFNEGLFILDVTDPAAVSQVASFDTADEASAVTVHNDLIYLGNGFAGFYVLELTTGTPVMFQGFQVDVSAGIAALSWEIAVDEAVAGLRIHRTNSAGNDLRTLPATGMLAPATRSFEDHSVEPGTDYFYTLAVVTTNGEIESGRIAARIPASPTRLHESYPNPFNPRSTIVFTLQRQERASVRVYDAGGRAVATLADRVFPAGRSELHWDGSDDNGRALPSGTYLYTLDTERLHLSGKMTLVR